MSKADNFVQFIDKGYLETNSIELQRLTISAYRLLAKGKPCSIAEIGLATGLDPKIVEEQICSLPDNTLERNGDGDIVALIGLSLTEGNHRFIVNGNHLFTWCAFDGIFLPELIGLPAVLKSSCRQTGNAITINVSPGGIEQSDPSSAVLSLVSPDAETCRTNIRGAFCNHVNLFESYDAFALWSKVNGGELAIDMGDAAIMAKRRNFERFPDVHLEPNENGCPTHYG